MQTPHKNAAHPNVGWRRVMFKNRKILGRRCAWGVTACFEQTQQIKAANRNLLGRRSFFGGLLGTHGRRGATVPPLFPVPKQSNAPWNKSQVQITLSLTLSRNSPINVVFSLSRGESPSSDFFFIIITEISMVYFFRTSCKSLENSRHFWCQQISTENKSRD